MRELSAIVLAAGKGTRMKSNRAKVTFEIADKPMVQRVVDSALKLNAAKVCVVVGWQKESVVSSLKPDSRISFVEQKEQLGTGHAVMIAEPIFAQDNTDIMILCGDVPLLSIETMQALYDKHIKEDAACTVLTAFLDDPGKYGRMLRDEQGRVYGIVEYKDATEAQRQIKEFNTGIYCFKAEELFKSLKKTTNTNQQGEFYLTDTLSILYNEGKGVASVVLDDLMEVSGVNSQEQLAELEDVFYNRIRKHWLNNGVIMHNPASILIGEDVQLEPDTEICSHCIIQGNTVVKKGAYIGPYCFIVNSIINEDAFLMGYNVVFCTDIESGEELPFQSVIEPGVPDV
ncbi:MAG: sugar phosphate nucleotidyltransferase [Candidatus Cloacimonetes bacterium]|nr:sugar phosphate nucleotidyltransferase [Candidatus Cloacimonadota bacterium]